MKKTLTFFVALLFLSGMATATQFDFEVKTSDAEQHFWGDIAQGNVQFGIDNSQTDSWYSHEIAKISGKVRWKKGGSVNSEIYYVSPAVTNSAKYGKATAEIYASGKRGRVNFNFATDFAGLTMGAGSYPKGWFNWAKYGVEVSARRNYVIGVSMSDVTNGTANNWFDYYMSGKKFGKIRFGNAKFSNGATWGDGHGSISISRWEYNSAEAEGKGFWGEDLEGEDYLENAKFELPNGGHITTQVWFNDGMSSTPIWVTAK